MRQRRIFRLRRCIYGHYLGSLSYLAVGREKYPLCALVWVKIDRVHNVDFGYKIGYTEKYEVYI